MSEIFSFPVRVYYEDTDAGGIVYHANYLKFYERARTEFLSSIGVEQDEILQSGQGFVVKKLMIDNKQAAFFNQRLSIKTQIKQLKKASLLFDQWIEHQDKIINTAEVEVVFIDLTHFKPIRIPSSLLEEIKRVS